MHKLKGVLFSLKDVLAHSGKIDPDLFEEVVKLLKFLLKNGIQPVLISNSAWTVEIAETGEEKEFATYLSEWVGSHLPYYQGGRDMDYKQSKSAMQFVLDQHGWLASEVFYVGSTHDDVKAASNGGFPLLKATWHGNQSDYGFEFASPREIASFFDCCCLTPTEWFWGIEHGDLRTYSIAPLAEHSRSYPQGAIYSTDAKNAVKNDVGNLRFWGLLMAARIHLSGIGAEINFVAPYPGHSTVSRKSKLMNAVQVVAGSLRAQYLYDLVERHTDALKSQDLRNAGMAPSAINQLNSIRINPAATRSGPQQLKYKSPPKLDGKTVLVVDDICTQGFSLEAARAFFRTLGANVIMLTWLKTPGPNDYHELVRTDPEIKDPFSPFTAASVEEEIHSNSGNVLNPNAPAEIAIAYKKYSEWDWS
ncbi:MAG: phosphoribosyltransferase family protein [Pseudomonadota bacterium]|nr:phosphoribosyltransferase family protein [Pseudomonadota bacterium]